jgi:hypothetical protein
MTVEAMASDLAGMGRSGAPLRFRDVVVSPYTDLGDYPREYFHRGGPDWPEWDRQMAARHCIAGEPFDVRPLPCEPEASIAEPLTWAGPIVPHFGHQVADYSMRLVPSLAEEPDRTLLFATHPRHGWHALADTPGWFREILDWVGIAPGRVRLVDLPMLVEDLAVVAQSEQVEGPGPSARHLDRMDELVDRRLGTAARTGAVYVSRAAQAARFAGERAIEVAMAAAGIQVVRPETLPLADQLAAYRSAELLMFAEGSAIHGTQLLGRSLGHVLVMVRTPEDGSGHATRVGEASLGPRARSLAYRSSLKGVVRGLMPDGRPHQSIGMPVLDPPTLIEQLRDVVPSLGDHWDRAAYESARDADVLEWLHHNASHPLLRSAASRAYIIESLEASGVGHLAAEARELLGPAREDAPRPMRSIAVDTGPSQAVLRRLARVAGAVGATTYLAIGPEAGTSADAVEVRRRVAVGPNLVAAEHGNVPSDGTIRIRLPADEFLAQARSADPYDLLHLTGPSTFEVSYRMLCGSLLRTHDRSLILIDATDPPGPYATVLGDARARELPAADAPAWQGEAYKVVVAIHDLHPGLDYATVGAGNESLTLVWRSRSADRRPLFGSIERIARLGYLNLAAHAELLHRASLDDALARWRSDGLGVAA